MGLSTVEYVVDGRDDHGQPSIIARYPSIPPSELKIKDDRKLPKKRKAERRALNHRDQTRLHELFVLPVSMERAKAHREERENALKVGKEKFKTGEKDANEKVVSSSQSAEVAQPPAQITSPSTTLSSQNASNIIIWFHMILCAIFFAMALFPDFRSWIVNEVIVTVGIDGFLPPLLQIACAVSEKCMETLPLTSNIILSLYSVFGFWPLAAVLVWAIWQTWDITTFVETSFRNLVLHVTKK
jgi:hypothetical protein